MQQLFAHKCDQIVKLSSEIRMATKTARMKKYADIVLELMTKVEGMLIQHITNNVSLLMMLSHETQMHIFRAASPELSMKMGRLANRYWLTPVVVAVAAPKYYDAWTNFWTPFLARNLPLGGDVCQHIASYIPYKMKHSQFIAFFRKHFNMYEFEYTTDRVPFQVEQSYSFVDSFTSVHVSDVKVVLYNVF
jgi:hypothetical protein